MPCRDQLKVIFAYLLHICYPVNSFESTGKHVIYTPDLLDMEVVDVPAGFRLTIPSPLEKEEVRPREATLLDFEVESSLDDDSILEGRSLSQLVRLKLR